MTSVGARSISSISCKLAGANNAQSKRPQLRAVGAQSAFLGSVRALELTRNGNSFARQAISVEAADRQMWLVGAEPPAHLDGKLAGDFGFDPLGLGTDPERLKWYAEAELQNGRWAMMAVAGILGTSLLGIDGPWYMVGTKEFDVPFLPLVAIQFAVMGFIEQKRLEGFKATGSTGLLNFFPFDPLNMSSPDMKVKEIKNGRLAMLAFVGFMMQALVTRTGPLENLTAHLADPTMSNITTSVMKLPEVIS